MATFNYIIRDTVNDAYIIDDTLDENEENVLPGNSCVFCLSVLTATWIFMPCKHANCCTECSARIYELGQPYPVCRFEIDDGFQIFSYYYDSFFLITNNI